MRGLKSPWTKRVQGRADVPKYTCFFHPDFNRRLGFTPIGLSARRLSETMPRSLPVENFTPP